MAQRVSVHDLLLLLATLVAEDRDDTLAAVETTLVVVVVGIEFAVDFVVLGYVAVYPHAEIAGAEFQLEFGTVWREDSDLVAGEDYSDLVVVVQTEAVAVVVVGSSGNCNSNIVATSDYKLRSSALDPLFGHYFALDAEESETEDKRRMVEPELQSLDVGSEESDRMSFALLLDSQTRLHSCGVQESGLEGDMH